MLLRNKLEIEEWLNKYDIKNYELIDDEEYGYVVNVNSNVSLYNKGLKSIDVKFNKIDGYFDCGFNYLTSLLGCPEIINGDFICYNNELTSLKEFPKEIGNLYLQFNNLNIKELIKLIDVKIIHNYIILEKNKNLGELQKITDFNELKKILTIYQEKNDLNLIVEKELNSLINHNKKLNKI